MLLDWPDDKNCLFLYLYCHQHHPGGCFSWCDKKQKKRQNSYAIKKTYENHIVWDMCFKRVVLNICSLSVALNKNGKLLNLVKTAWLRLSSGINNSFWSLTYTSQQPKNLHLISALLYYASVNYLPSWLWTVCLD